jgi:hypothetical protein
MPERHSQLGNLHLHLILISTLSIIELISTYNSENVLPYQNRRLPHSVDHLGLGFVERRTCMGPPREWKFPIIVYTSLLASVHSLMHTKQIIERSVHEHETAFKQDRKAQRYM